MDTELPPDTRVLDAADDLFYAHGVQAVGVDRIRDASGVSLKRLYQCFPSKGAIVEAYLRRRDQVSRTALEEHIAGYGSPREQLLGMFEWLHDWFRQPGFRGCAFNNAFGELGAGSDAVAEVVRTHKAALRARILSLVEGVGAADPEAVTAQIVVLFDGAITVATVSGTPEAALQARDAVAVLLDAHGGA
ncbi:TetR/AcrR family transcriptional regulator [Streptomyces marispadix]|uniref:TetR/AcrR family transcriptional regulator n=1 Tax=Streptomyces marispadix TaxID=2922868 RepID=A0ABS9T633_9ACTN|nr:TetR/AcrR family transcriptional regulator [Streptomyces marispadix]MCH6163974.1 TetR/AcrR family transcriptional regulator [Streptomyces marispadix]